MPPVEDLVLMQLLAIGFVASWVLVHDRGATNPFAVVALAIASLSALAWFAMAPSGMAV